THFRVGWDAAHSSLPCGCDDQAVSDVEFGSHWRGPEPLCPSAIFQIASQSKQALIKPRQVGESRHARSYIRIKISLWSCPERTQETIDAVPRDCHWHH